MLHTRNLVGKEMFEFRKLLLASTPAKNLDALQKRMIPPAGVKRDFFVIDGAPYDEVIISKFLTGVFALWSSTKPIIMKGRKFFYFFLFLAPLSTLLVPTI